MTPSDLLTNIARFWARVDRGGPDECWHWTGETNRHGYGRFDLWHDNQRSRILAHRLVLILTGVRLADEAVVRHTCDTPPCCNPAHLRVGTQLDNVRDALDKGRLNTSGLALGLATRWGRR